MPQICYSPDVRFAIINKRRNVSIAASVKWILKVFTGVAIKTGQTGQGGVDCILLCLCGDHLNLSHFNCPWEQSHSGIAIKLIIAMQK